MMICKECGFECKSVKALKIHLTKKHKLDAENYYIKQIAPAKICVDCGQFAKFINIDLGFDERCAKCRIRFLQRQHYQNMSADEKLAIANKNKAAKLKNHGCENYCNTAKAKQTKLKKYGDENYNNRHKAKQTYPTHTQLAVSKQKQTHFNNWLDRFSRKVKDFFNVADITASNAGYRINMRCNACHCEFSFVKNALNNYMRWNVRNICPRCFPTCKTSRAEREIYDFVVSLGENAIANDHTVLGKKELDIYIPDKKIGIEYDGLFWHSAERGKCIKDKSDLCKMHNVQCIHVFEDEWLNKPQIVKSLISGVLGHNKQIPAGKTQFHEIAIDTANEFLEKNHLQGKCACQIAGGLFFDNSLAVVMTFDKSPFDKNAFIMSRFANMLNTNVIGGDSKLLKHILDNHNEIREIIATADLRWDTGDMYFKLGFEKIGEKKPNKFFFLNNFARLPESDTNNDDAKYNTIYDCGLAEFKYTRRNF